MLEATTIAALTNNNNIQAKQQDQDGTTTIGTSQVPARFEVQKVNGQIIVSDISSLAAEQAKGCLLTTCITKEEFPIKSSSYLTVNWIMGVGCRSKSAIN